MSDELRSIASREPEVTARLQAVFVPPENEYMGLRNGVRKIAIRRINRSHRAEKGGEIDFVESFRICT